MKVLIYDNKEKDKGGVWLSNLISLLKEQDISYKVIEMKDLQKKESADALFVLGGDGTILLVADFASENDIPIIGINSGKLGFLTEFELYHAKEAIQLLVSSDFKFDKRTLMDIEFKGKKYCALNDVYLQRFCYAGIGNMNVEIVVDIDGESANKFKGDGIIISTPTGSTAYSLSVGGPILTPQMKAFIIAPIAAHCINQKPVVFSSSSVCTVSVRGKSNAGLFIDGKFIDKIDIGDVVTIRENSKIVKFLRKKDFNFYNRLSQKLNNNF